MPVPTPVHSRTLELCTSLRFKDWAGCYAVCSYDTCSDREYFALRHAAGLIDVSPLHKYDVRGPDAAAFLSRVMVRPIAALKIGRVTYCCWCDTRGKVLDDGTVARLAERHYRVTSAEPALAWLSRCAHGYNVVIEDTSRTLAALAVQGPGARSILADCAGPSCAGLPFFGVCSATIDGAAVWVSRTGYTGDLGYEVWIDAERAPAVWDALTAAGRPHGLLPAGLDAMDITRVEAGFVLNGVDYFPAPRCLIKSRMSTPYELGLGWMVRLDREAFSGQAALREECRRGPVRSLVGLEVDWEAFEALFARFGLPPELPAGAWRTAVPVYHSGGCQAGQATSGAWSPLLKKNLALATVAAPYERLGTRLQIEVTAEYHRGRVAATVVRTPFFDPPRKRA